MSYQPYVAAAYAIFIVVMLWDWLAPMLQLRKGLRTARGQARRNTAHAAGSKTTPRVSPPEAGGAP